MFGERGDPDGDRQPDRQPRLLDERLRLDHLPHPLRDDHRLVRVGLDEEDDELVPAVADHRVGIPDAGAQDRSHLHQHAAADKMPVGVVDPLEKVDVHEEDAEEVPVPFGALHLPIEDHVEVAAVVEFREVVDVDQALRLRAALRVEQGETRLALEEIEERRVEDLRVGSAPHPQHGVHTGPGGQVEGHGEKRAVLREEIRAAGRGRVQRVGMDHGRAGTRRRQRISEAAEETGGDDIIGEPQGRDDRVRPPSLLPAPEQDPERGSQRLAEFFQDRGGEQPHVRRGDHRDAEVEQFVERHPPEQAVPGEEVLFDARDEGACKRFLEEDLGNPAFQRLEDRRPFLLRQDEDDRGLGGEREEVGHERIGPLLVREFPGDDDGEILFPQGFRTAFPFGEDREVDAFQGRNTNHALQIFRVGGEDQDTLSGHRPAPIRGGTCTGRDSVTSAAKDISTPRCELTAGTIRLSRRNGP